MSSYDLGNVARGLGVSTMEEVEAQMAQMQAHIHDSLMEIRAVGQPLGNADNALVHPLMAAFRLWDYAEQRAGLLRERARRSDERARSVDEGEQE